MSEQSTSAGAEVRPNLILRGGPFDGRQLEQEEPFETLAINEGGDTPFFVYRPSGERDTEYPTLAEFVLDHMEPI